MITSINVDHPHMSDSVRIDLTQCTLLVGDQGCGKSTVLKLLADLDSEYIEYAQARDSKLEGYIHYDSEKHNPGIKTRIPERGAAAVALSKFESHGETSLRMLEGLQEFENRLILLDEPEASLSIRSIYRLGTLIFRLLEKGNQLVIATHHPLLIDYVSTLRPSTIFDLERGQRCSHRDLVRFQQETAND